MARKKTAPQMFYDPGTGQLGVTVGKRTFIVFDGYTPTGEPLSNEKLTDSVGRILATVFNGLSEDMRRGLRKDIDG